jgi:hypothetical protein
MRIVCCYCLKDLGEKYPLQPGVSHGICEECMSKVSAAIEVRRDARAQEGGKVIHRDPTG